MYNTSEESQTEVISETAVRTGPDVRGGMKKPAPERGSKKPAPSTRAPKKPSPAPRADTKPAPSTRVDKQMKEESSIDEGIMGALKKVGKAVLGPADQSPEAEAARMGKRRGPGTPMKKADTPNMKEDADVFDIVKEYLMTEHDATEEEALKVMLELTDEERTSIVEGIIGQTADNIARAVGTAVGTGERAVRELPGYLKQKAKNVKSTFDSARERASSNNPDVRSGRMVSNKPAKKTSPANKETP